VGHRLVVVAQFVGGGDGHEAKDEEGSHGDCLDCNDDWLLTYLADILAFIGARFSSSTALCGHMNYEEFKFDLKMHK